MTIPKIASYKMPSRDNFCANKVNWVLDPKKAVLLVHDMQRYFLDFYGEDSPLINELIANIVHLRSFCREQGMKIVYTAQPVEQTAKDRALLNDMWGKGIDNKPELKDIIYTLTPDPEETVLTKWRYSAFMRSPLEELMQEWQCDQLLICGVYAHIGCMMTAAHAFQLDIKPFVVGDAVADFSLSEHEMALKYVATRCGMVTSVEEILRR